ncbi:MAG TPA: PH domain-containing protein [Patescibacteria group bacterium]|nr:PH domain-containing protein [Patescibacteria group bacterium]
MPDIFINKKQEDDGVDKPKEVDTPPVPDDIPKTEAERHAFPGHTHNRLSAFCLYPDGVDFETRDEKEKIILLLRQHPIVNFKWILTTLALLTGPTIISLLGVFSTLPTGFPLVITLAWYLVTSAYAIEGFLDWYFNVYFITTQRVVDVDFYNLINKRVSDAEIEKIQDVSYATGGVLRTLLNYGDVFIQTAAEVSEFKFEAVPSPEKVVKILDDLRMKT